MSTSKNVPESTPGSAGLVAHVQTHNEQQKALLARELHDEMGGLLVGAMMDLAWAEQHLSAPVVDLKSKLVRARQTLATAIDLKRRLIEELRPTLLDNVGLFAALKWHIQGACTQFGLTCEIHVPEYEPRFPPDVPIALFRIGQEALDLALADRTTVSAEFAVHITKNVLTFEISTTAPPALLEAHLNSDSYPLAAVRHRVSALGGQFEIAYRDTGGIQLKATFPLAP